VSRIRNVTSSVQGTPFSSTFKNDRPVRDICTGGPIAGYRSDLDVTPGQEFIKPSNLVVSNAVENVGEPGLRNDAVEFGGVS